MWGCIISQRSPGTAVRPPNYTHRAPIKPTSPAWRPSLRSSLIRLSPPPACAPRLLSSPGKRKVSPNKRFPFPHPPLSLDSIRLVLRPRIWGSGGVRSRLAANLLLGANGSRIVFSGRCASFLCMMIRITGRIGLGDHGVSARFVVLSVLDVGVFVVSARRFVRGG